MGVESFFICDAMNKGYVRHLARPHNPSVARDKGKVV